MFIKGKPPSCLSHNWMNTWHRTKPCLIPSPDINIKVIVNSTHDWREKSIATFSVEDLLQVFWIFHGVEGEKEKWSGFSKESIINQECIFWRLLKKHSLIHPSYSSFYFMLTGEVRWKGEISWWFKTTFSSWIHQVKGTDMGLHLWLNCGLPSSVVFKDLLAEVNVMTPLTFGKWNQHQLLVCVKEQTKSTLTLCEGE